ncbi:hypothetical protein T10_10130 [Trichinella papuae]|uniref:Uncharacterized protein n=1 Tax=Trichinella papuae TaxID=268474 RepID=A0A0V1MMP7_9BILA|nr:hypothetical protein T10_10130 [Trichinella papuae]
MKREIVGQYTTNHQPSSRARPALLTAPRAHNTSAHSSPTSSLVDVEDADNLFYASFASPLSSLHLSCWKFANTGNVGTDGKRKHTKTQLAPSNNDEETHSSYCRLCFH